MARNHPGYTPPNEAPQRPTYPVLSGQKALVTGASKGLGAGIAIALAEAGADILVNYCGDHGGAELTAAKVRAAGRTAVVVKADVSREAEVLEMYRRMIDELGRIDILINNAGF
ncbi:MAG: SDR family NAD(P)-dependent oxidoreductase, partial [Spirochaetia bacterium]